MLRFELLGCALILGFAGCSTDVDDLFGSGGAAAGGAGQGGFGQGGAGTTASVATSTVTVGGPGCGDGVVLGDEQCDGAELAGASCSDLGYQNPAGALCSPACVLDFAGCQAECGNGQPEPGEECDDGNQNPADGCNNCMTVSGGCGSASQVNLAPGTTQIDSSTQGASLLAPLQSSGCDSASGPEQVFAINPSQNGFLTAYLPSQNATFDSVLYLRNECPEQASQVACHDNYGTSGDRGGEVVSLPVMAGNTVYLVVDGFDGGSGDFRLLLDLSSGEDCSDPVPLPVEGDAPISVVGSTNGFSGQAQCLAGFGLGADVVYALAADSNDTYSLEVSAGYNSVLNARSTCDQVTSELGCSSPNGSNDSNLTLSFGNDSTTFVWIDGTNNQSGTYRLLVSHP